MNGRIPVARATDAASAAFPCDDIDIDFARDGFNVRAARIAFNAEGDEMRAAFNLAIV